MTYNRPEVIKLNSALRAIQGIDKPLFVFPDALYPDYFDATIGAYESDE
jgi:hypothetical protein